MKGLHCSTYSFRSFYGVVFAKNSLKIFFIVIHHLA